MAGRPQGPQQLVAPNDILAIAAERWHLGTLFAQVQTTEAYLQWMCCAPVVVSQRLLL